VREKKRRRQGWKGVIGGSRDGELTEGGMKTAATDFSPADSGFGWCGGVKQTKAEAKAKADDGDAERRCRQWRGGAHGFGG
jgi:hypothetical protein